MIVTLNKINTNCLQTSKIFIVHQPSPPFPAHYQSHFFSRTFLTVQDVIPFIHCNVQNLSPNLEGKLSKASFDKFAYCSVAGGGPWSTTLVNLTALSIVSFSLPSMTWPYHTLNIPSAGASEKEQGLSLKSVYLQLAFTAFKSCLKV